MKSPEYSGGRRNHYRPGMPWSERLTKDVKSWLTDLRLPKSAPSILTYPDYPSNRTSIQGIAATLPARLSNKPSDKIDVALYFHDATHKEFELPPLPEDTVKLNEDCRDISKVKVDAVHHKVFGYGTFVDPRTHQGPAVEKSDANATHDGHIIHLPISDPRPGFIYQIILDNTVSDTEVMDLRVPVMGEVIPMVFGKYKTMDLRFTNDMSRSDLRSTKGTFSNEELDQIRRFCVEMKADFCELDIIRDKASDLIYIIDLNTTPYGPPAGLKEDDRLKALQLYSEAFREAYLPA